MTRDSTGATERGLARSRTTAASWIKDRPVALTASWSRAATGGEQDVGEEPRRHRPRRSTRAGAGPQAGGAPGASRTWTPRAGGAWTPEPPRAVHRRRCSPRVPAKWSPWTWDMTSWSPSRGADPGCSSTRAQRAVPGAGADRRPVQLTVCDLSFISHPRGRGPAVRRSPEGPAARLVRSRQFEVAVDNLSRTGVVTSEQAREDVVRRVTDRVATSGWTSWPQPAARCPARTATWNSSRRRCTAGGVGALA
ncbi:hypothetical protein QJS66_06085 [Kocuria rhizophila]|nr:hypothetical protein QJS66_06085 [Kocuria rhizophila]